MPPESIVKNTDIYIRIWYIYFKIIIGLIKYIIVNIHANICDIVLIFPHKFAAKTISFLMAISLINITKNSLVIIISTTHTFVIFNFKKHKKAAIVKTLSASGSRNFPKFVIKLYLRAINPSIASVMEAKTNIISAA